MPQLPRPQRVVEVVASGVGRTTVTKSSGSNRWRRALLVIVAALLVTGSVAAQALDLTPLAIVCLVLAVISLAPLALPAVEP